MGEIILSQAGRAVGNALLPNGIDVFGAGISGSALGGLAGSLLGRSIDRALAPDVNGPRLKSLPIMESREGAGIARVYGRGRVGGQLIWAARFRERRRSSGAGKGGRSVNTYTYTASFAVAIAEGPISRLGNVWANGEVLALNDYNWRLYKGTTDQLPDPLIEAVEGEGLAPAYRGTAYIVFEDFPLDAFGNRLPQLSFEVIRSRHGEGLQNLVDGVNIIPASGEFVYGTTVERERRFPGIERPLNMNNSSGASDFNASLQQLEDELPGVGHASLTVAWFGDDLRAGHCRIRPGVETRERASVPSGWQVGEADRQSARLVSQTGGTPNYGGTPSDHSVLEAIAAMKASGIDVTLSPFLLMDIPPENDLPGLDGEPAQPAFPWRGRISTTSDGTAGARSDIAAFMGDDGAYGFRHFILHHARLAVEAGGVHAFLIGSEMTGLTRIRDDTGAFPFVEELITLAGEVKAIVGAGTHVSYAPDWTEYGAFVPPDGSGDVFFPLDPLWACEHIDFVAIDWYAPLGDWRSGPGHTDALAGYMAADDPAYLQSGLQGGEAFDWYYASDSDRDTQARTPITDTAHSEHWIFRPKDIAGWWSNAHHERLGGVREETPTDWLPGNKSVWLMELGFPAVDKGTNAPNLFHDPKSAESALPPFSNGTRDDILQRRALEAALGYWKAQPFIERCLVWAWDARPWPDFPGRDTIWADGPNWSLGHWLNGRSGLIAVSDVIEDLAASAGVALDASALPGLAEGLRLDGPMTLREALEPLHALHGFSCAEREDGLYLLPRAGTVSAVSVDDTVLGSLNLDRPMLDKRPGRLALSYIDGSGAYDVAVTDARTESGDPAYTIRASLPLVLSKSLARTIASELLAATHASEAANVALGPAALALEPGDAVEVEGAPGTWTINDVTDEGLQRTFSLERPAAGAEIRAATPPLPAAPATRAAEPELVLIDAPLLEGATSYGPLVAASGEPWISPVSVEAGRDLGLLTERSRLDLPAMMGRLLQPVGQGPSGRWDFGNTVHVAIDGAELSSASPSSVLAGANRFLLQGNEGWELLSFCEAERGQAGSRPAEAAAGSVCVIVDGAIGQAAMQADEAGVDLFWRAGQGTVATWQFNDVANRPWPVVQPRVVPDGEGGVRVTWLPAGPAYPDSWDLPDPLDDPHYEVEILLDGELMHAGQQVEPALHIDAPGAVVRIAQLSSAGRRGQWVSIETGAP